MVNQSNDISNCPFHNGSMDIESLDIEAAKKICMNL